MRIQQPILPPKPKDRILVLGEEVSQESVGELIKSIYDINLEDEERESIYVEYERLPIHLLINTYGGSVYDGLALIGAIELSTTPIVVTCLGSAMSMGMFILASGHHRRAHHYSTVMYHEMSVGIFDKLEGVKADIIECKRLEDLCNGILFKRTKLKSKDLTPHINKKGDWYLSAADALKYGIIDEIIGQPLVNKENIKNLPKVPLKKTAIKRKTRSTKK